MPHPADGSLLEILNFLIDQLLKMLILQEAIVIQLLDEILEVLHEEQFPCQSHIVSLEIS